jgi:glycosyltransferase involved in cell wall biosynthesis
MKVAMIGQKGIPASYGGVERHVEELAAALCEAGHEVTVYSRPRYAPPRKRGGGHRGIRVKTLPSIATKHLDAISHTLASTLHALAQDYDIVHYHGIGPSLVSPLARASGARVVLTVHALDWQRAKWGRIARFSLRAGEAAGARCAARVIAVSPIIQEYLRRAYGIESVYIPNGVSPPHVRPLDALRRRIGVEEGFLLYLGRFVPEKGCHLLIRAFRGVRTDKKLLMAGRAPAHDPYIARLKQEVAGDPRIVFPGGLYEAEKEEALSHAGLFCLPSEVEGMPIGLLEAMSYGRCVVASDIPENRAVLSEKDAVFGLMFRSGDVEDLRRALQHALDNPAEAAALGRRAAEHVRHRCNWKDVARLTAEVYAAAH